MSRAVILFCALAACAHSQAPQSRGEAELQQRPVIPPLSAFNAPVPKIHTLANGLKIYVVEKPGDGIEALQLVVRRGSANDPTNLPGLASLAMEMLESGSAGRSQADSARAFEAIGATVHAGARLDGSVVAGSSMVQKLPQLVPLFADFALRPNFDAKEWQKLLAQREAELIAERAEPRSAASKSFSRAIYGEHPYGRPVEGTVESVKAMQLADAKALWASFRPAESALIAVGGASESQVVELLRGAFEGWKGPAEATQHPELAAPPRERPRVVVIDFPSKPQTVVRVGQPSVPRNSPDVLALRLWNAIVGGSFTSRLEQNLREKHGYTYGAGSGFAFGIGAGPFTAGSDVKTEVTAEALKELLGELERAVAQPITADELKKGKALLAYGLVQALEHAESAAGLIAQPFLYSLPNDDLATFPERLRKLTVEDVHAAARRVLEPGSMTIVLSGDARSVQSQLEKSGLALPAPQRRDAKGDVVSGR